MFKVNNTYTSYTDAEAASIIHNFSDGMLEDILDVTLKNLKSNPIGTVAPNMAYSNELNYKAAVNQYGANTEMQESRDNLNRQIIQTICNYYNISYVGNDLSDIYNIAFIMYKFFISEYSNNIINFYINYIIKESNGIVSSILHNKTKTKDSSTSYGKLLFAKDQNIGYIHSHIETVIDNIKTFDIDFNTVIQCATIGEPLLSNFLLSNLSDNGDFYINHIQGFITPFNKPEIITAIRLGIQNKVSTDTYQIKVDNLNNTN